MRASLITPARRLPALAALTAGALAVAACGSSDSGSSGSDGGSTITVGGAGPLNNPTFSDPQRKAGIEAAIGAINASGGVQGRKLQLSWCDTKYDPNGELACGRKFAADKVSAVLAPAFLADPTGRAYTELQKAKIPVVGDQGLLPAGLNSPISFPLAGGLPGWAFGAADLLIKAGAKRIAVFVDPNPGAQFAGQLVTGALKSAGRKPAAVVTGDPKSDPALSSAAAKAMRGGTDGVVITVAPLNFPKAVVALRQAGYKGKIASLTAIVPDKVLAALKGAADGVLLTSQLALVSDTSNAGVKKFLADMKRYQPSATVDENAETAWAATQLFAKATAGLRDFSGKSVLGALNGTSSPIDIGVTAGYKVDGVTSPLKDFTRMVNPTVHYGEVSGTETVPSVDKGAVNPFASLGAAQ